MSASIDLGTISASVALDLTKVQTGRALMSRELSAIGGALDRLALQAEADGKRIAAATFGREQQAALKAQENALKAQAAQAQAFRTATVGAFTGVAAGLTLAGIAAVKLSADFESSMTKISNNTTMTAADVAKMKQTVVALGKESGASFDDLGQGFMHIANFGFKASEATVILREAMKSAVATGAKTADTADILAKTLHEFSLGAGDAGKAMNVLHLAAAQGNMTLEQFDQAAGPAFAQAANLGVGLTDVSAAMSALTRHGLDASEAATQVKDILVHMINPSKQARQELERLSEKTGINLVADFSQAGLKAKGFTGVLDDLARATNGNGQEIYKLIQAQRGGLGAMILAGTGAKDYKDILASLSDAMSGKVDPATQGYQKSLKTLNTEIARVANEIRADFLPVGEKLTPLFEAAIPVIHETADVLGHVLDVFAALPQPVQEGVLAVGAFKLGTIGLNMALGTLGGSLPSLVGGVGKLKGAFGGVALAEGEAATAGAGMAGFAAGGAWALAIGAAIALVWSLGRAWHQVKNAQHETLQDVLSHGLNGIDVDARDKAFQEIKQGVDARAAHGADGNVDAQIAANRAEAKRILASPDYAAAKSQIPALEKQIRDVRAGGVKAFTAHGESPQTAVNEYFFALKAAQDQLAAAVQAKTKMDKDAHDLRADANRMQPDSQTSGIGAKIAESAWKKQIGLDRAAYNDGCQKLARETVQAVSPAFDKIWDRSKNATAITNLKRFQAAGLAQKYTPGMDLLPGTLLYSETMGKRGKQIDGHVQVVGPGGHRYDQHGQDQFALKNFQWYVPPPGVKVGEAAAVAAAKSGSGGYTPPVDAGALADLQKRAYEATHSDFQNRRYEAAQQFSEDKKTDPTLAKKTYLATLKQINADERAEQKKHYEELLRLWKEHKRQMAEAAKQADQAQRADRDARLKIVTDAKARQASLSAMGVDMDGQIQALTQDPDEVGFAKQEEAAHKQRRERDAGIKAKAGYGPYGGDQMDPGPLLQKSAQIEADALKQIQALRDAKADREREQAEESGQEVTAKYAEAMRAADEAARKQQEDIEETARFEYEQGMISLGQYQAFLKAKLASTQEWADASHTILSKDWMRAKADYDASLGQKKQKPGQDPGAWLGDGMKNDAGKLMEDVWDGGAKKLHSLKSAVKDWEDATIKAIKHIAVEWAMASLFGSKFGGGFNFGGPLGGPQKSAQAPAATGMVSGIAALAALTQGKPAGPGAAGGSPAGTSLPPGLGGLLGAGGVGQIQGINGAIGGFGQGGPMGALSGLGSLAPLLAHGGLLGGVLGHGGMAGLFAHGGLMTSGGALGGLGAALPWIGGGLLLNSVLGNPFKKLFKHLHLFSSGGIVPGSGHTDSVPALLTPGEVVTSHKQLAQQRHLAPITINHYGDNHNAGDVSAMHSDWAWGVSQQLATAVPGT